MMVRYQNMGFNAKDTWFRMDSIFDNYSKKPKIQAIKGDFIDRLHGGTTISFLFLILILVVFRQSMYSNIICWNPSQFSDGQVGYAHQFCWINSTYHYPGVDDPEKFSTDKKVTIGYYQFILFILVGQILLFYIPSLIWSIIASNSKGYINKLMDIVSSKPKISDVVNKNFLEAIKPIAKRKHHDNKDMFDSSSSDTSEPVSIHDGTKAEYCDEKLQTINEEPEADFEKPKQQGLIHRQTSSKPKSLKVSQSTRERNIKQKLVKALNPIKGVKGLTFKYFLLKIINLANTILQLFLLNQVFGGKFLDYGFRYAKRLWRAQNPLLFTREFPIFTLCDFYIHQANRQIHYNTVQCILTINVLLEKFYVLIWFWLIILATVTFWNLISWIYEITCSSQASFLFKYLTIQHNMRKNTPSSSSSTSRMLPTTTLVANGEHDLNEKKGLLESKSIESTLDMHGISELQNTYLGMRKNTPSSSSSTSRMLPTTTLVANGEHDLNEKKGLLESKSIESTLDMHDISDFQNKYLGRDGLVMLLIVKSVAGDVAFIDLLGVLWKDFHTVSPDDLKLSTKPKLTQEEYPIEVAKTEEDIMEKKTDV